MTHLSSEEKSALITTAAAVAIVATVAWAGSTYSWGLGPLPAFTWACLAAVLIQWAAFIPAQIARTEKYFDAVGSGTFTAITVALLLLAPKAGPLDWMLAAMVVLWALRLGSFLFIRVQRSGSDSRFDQIKNRPLVFLRTWTLQGAWVSLSACAAWVVLSHAHEDALSWVSLLGLGLWMVGMGFEIISDVQKSQFKKDPANKGKFITTGLWSLSRHPNYFGEIVLWVGVFIAASPALRGWEWVAVVSPLFIMLLLTRVSGVPLLEASADKRWGGTAEYEQYKATTPVLIPRLAPSR